MAIRYIKAKIVRSEMHQIVRDVPAWELPILEAMHQSVEQLGDVILNRPVPDAQEEYTRLERRYGRQENDDGSRGKAYVAAIFGEYGVGVATLKREIEKSVVAAVSETGEDLLGMPA